MQSHFHVQPNCSFEVVLCCRRGIANLKKNYQLGLTPALRKGIFALKRAKIKCFILSFRMGPEVICHVSILEQLRPSLGLKILKLKVGQFWVGLQTLTFLDISTNL